MPAFENTCRRWQLTPEQRAALSPHAVDVVGMSLTLGGMFDESTEAENAWLRASRAKLAGLSALDAMTTGKFADATSLLRDEAGY